METPGRILSFFRTAARGLEAQRIAMSTATENIANARTTRTENGEAYRIKRATHQVSDDQYARFSMMLSGAGTSVQGSKEGHISGDRQLGAGGVDLGPTTQVVEQMETRREYDPSHPHADAAGYVEYPDINVVEEMARMISANRIYEANLSSVESAKDMIKRTLEI